MRAALALAIAWGCTPVEPPVEAPVTQEAWTRARGELAEMRKNRPDHAYAERVRVGVTDPRNGKQIQARGALAVSPNNAARLVLVGPGGSTAVDAWVTRDRYRISVPAMQIERRGTDAAGALGVPVGFLRWWFLAPLEGKLLTMQAHGADDVLVLSDGESTFRITKQADRLLAVRRSHGNQDGLEWFAHDLAPAAGQHGRYIDRDHHIDVEVTIEAVMPDEPDPAAFIDPDSKEGQPL